MNMNQISTSSLKLGLTDQVQKMQKALAQANIEASTGRAADIGLKLGAETAQSVSLRANLDALQAFQDGNNLVSARLSATQNALSSLQGTAQSFLQSLVSGSSGSGPTLAAQARTNLQGTAGVLNTSVDNSYIFGGINSGVAPVADYTALPASAAKQAFDTSFMSAFGMAPTSAGAVNISPAQMQTFLDGPFKTLTQGAGWANISSASSLDQQSQIGPSETVHTSVSANDSAFQALTSAYTMMSELGGGNFSAATAKVISATATKVISAAIGGIQVLATRVGTVQAAISASNDRMSAQTTILNTQIGNLENIDAYSAAARVTALTTQIQTAYSLTAQVEQLSLVKYLPA